MFGSYSLGELKTILFFLGIPTGIKTMMNQAWMGGSPFGDEVHASSMF
jgi:hypothetical protein